MEYIIVFDDGSFAGIGSYVREYPDAKLFTSKSKAEKYARTFNKDYTVISTEDYERFPV